MDALDGNAIAGTLFAVFGEEMTTARSVCANCGTSSYLAELKVYLRAPGTIARCGNCGKIAMVFVEIRGVTCVDMRGLETLAARETSG